MSWSGISKKSIPKTVNSNSSSTQSLHQHQQSTYFQKSAVKTTSRSVKSIVAWLESSSNQAWYHRNSVAEIPNDLSSSSLTSSPRKGAHKQSVSAASDVEDYSLTYLKYKKYFMSVPLGRCLDAKDSQEVQLSGASEIDKEVVYYVGRDRATTPASKDIIVETGHDTDGRGTEHCFFERDADEVKMF